jgi:transcriptional regulator with XRE-family HTH domain
VAAEAAGISRVTLYRIEKGEPSVTIGAWANALAVLDMQWSLRSPDSAPQTPSPELLKDWLPLRIRLSDYPQLKALAWHIQGTDVLTPAEALDIYERNARHLDAQAMPAHEQALLAALREAFGRPSHV